MTGRVTELSTLVKRASQLGAESTGAHRMLPVAAELAELFPGGGLRRGSTVAVSPGAAPGATSLLLTMLSAASRNGSWIAVVGVPRLGLLAAVEQGIALDRLALIPNAGTAVDKVVATLLDGFDIVVTSSAVLPTPSVRAQLAARARSHGSILVPFRQSATDATWDSTDLSLSTERSVWHGLGWGHGRLRSHELTVAARGKGRPQQVTMLLHGPAPAARKPDRILAALPAAPSGFADRASGGLRSPRLTVVRPA